MHSSYSTSLDAINLLSLLWCYMAHPGLWLVWHWGVSNMCKVTGIKTERVELLYGAGCQKKWAVWDVKLICCLLNGLFNPFLVSVHTWSVYCIDVFRPLKHGQHTMEQTYVPSGHLLSSELCKYNITVRFCVCSEAPPDTRPGGIWITHPHQVSPHRWYLMWVWSKPKWEIWKNWSDHATTV